MNRTILVTGASKGIGQSIAIKLAAQGFDIVVHYASDKAGAESTAETVRKAGREARTIAFDISKRDECREMLERDIKDNGAYYGAVLNAGIARDNAFPAMEESEWDDVIGTNLDGFYNVLRPVVMPMVSKRKGGRIVTLSFVSGIAGNRGQVNYSAAKAGIIGATKALAIELAKRAITVNCVAPGIIKTQMTDNLPEEIVNDIVPLRRMGRAEEVAATVAFLCSDEAAYITRQAISVNGGMV